MNTILVNNLGTIMYTLVFGKEIGRDAFGNRYFVSRKKKSKKWVLYNKVKDPSVIPVEWQIWLTDDSEKIKSDTVINNKFSWEKERIHNLTGSFEAYHPAKKFMGSKIKSKKKYKNWEPNSNDSK